MGSLKHHIVFFGILYHFVFSSSVYGDEHSSEGVGVKRLAPKASLRVTRSVSFERKLHSLPAVGSIAVMVVADDALLYYGPEKRKRLPENFVTASTAKWLVAATMMTLVDDGLVSLDHSVSRYLPIFEGEKGQVTLRQLLSHTSGFSAHLKKGRGKGLNLSETVDEIAKQPLLFAPGTRFCYGNLSFVVAARIAEVVLHRQWQEIFDKRIAGPVGMTATRFPSRGRSGGLYQARTTLPDYINFLKMFQQGGVSVDGRRVLSVEAVDEMKRNQTEGMEICGVNLRQHRKMARVSYGLGLWRERVNPQTGEPDAVSHFGSSGFRGMIDYRNHYVIAMAYRGRKKSRSRINSHYGKVLALINQLAGHSTVRESD